MSDEAGAAMRRTRVLVLVGQAADSERATQAGALAVLVRDGRRANRTVDGSLPLIWIEDWTPGGPLAAGTDGSVLILAASSERLLSRYDYPALASYAQICRASGIPFGFAGALEPPDVPRLLPLGPALLGFEGPLGEPELQALVASLGPPAATVPHPVPDRVFIRDFVQEMEIGAYRSERGRCQRVRFGVEVELAPVRGSRSMADIYSYDRMMDAVRATAVRSPEAFVETLAEDLAAEILQDHRVQAVTVRVEKLDLGPAAAGVEIRRTRL